MAAMFSRARRFSAACRSRAQHHPGEDLREGEDELALLVELHSRHRHDGIRRLPVGRAGPVQQLVEAGDVEVAVVLHEDQAGLLAPGQLMEPQKVVSSDDPAPGQQEVAHDFFHVGLVRRLAELEHVLFRYHRRFRGVRDHAVDERNELALVQRNWVRHGKKVF
jgi:hypothetical protein